MSRRNFTIFVCVLFYILLISTKVTSLITFFILGEIFTSELSCGFNFTRKNEVLSGESQWLGKEYLLSDMKTIFVIITAVPTVLHNPLVLWQYHSNISDDVLQHLSKNSINQKLSLLREFTKVPSQTCWVFPFSLREYVNKSESTRKEDCMNYEWGRYESFKEFPMDSPARPTRLASSGFFYTGFSDKVKCFSCNLEYSSWQDGDEPITIHKVLSPNCDFVKGIANDNVPIHPNSENVPDSNLFQTDGCTGGASVTETIDVERDVTNVNAQHQSLQGGSTNKAGFAAIETTNHKFPEYERIQNRLDSFKGWSNADVTDPMTLATAGFIYAGFGDCVKCFSCGGGLRNWEYGDSPWEEHARWFSGCRFLREEKGIDFVRQHQEVQIESREELPRKEISSSNVISGDESLKPLEENQNIPRDYGSHQTDRGENECKTITNEVKEKLNEMGLCYSFEEIRRMVYRFNDLGHQSLTTEFIITQLIEDQDNLENTEQDSRDNTEQDSRENTEQVSRGSTEGRNETDQHNDYNNTHQNNEIGTKNLPKDPNKLQEENINLKSQLMCKICMDSDSSVVFIPCGHMVSCEKCAPNIHKCAICRLPIKGRVKTFMS